MNAELESRTSSASTDSRSSPANQAAATSAGNPVRTRLVDRQPTCKGLRQHDLDRGQPRQKEQKQRVLLALLGDGTAHEGRDEEQQEQQLDARSWR